MDRRKFAAGFGAVATAALIAGTMFACAPQGEVATTGDAGGSMPENPTYAQLIEMYPNEYNSAMMGKTDEEGEDNSHAGFQPLMETPAIRDVSGAIIEVVDEDDPQKSDVAMKCVACKTSHFMDFYERDGPVSYTHLDVYKRQAQAYLEMPMGVMFTAADYAAASGRAEDECAQICEDLSARGLLFRSRSNGTPEYHQLAEAHGIWEYNMNNYEKDDGAYPAIHNSQWGADIILQLYNARSSFYNAVPCSREVVADNEIALPYDDFEAIVDKFDKIAVSPCQCRLSHKALGIPCLLYTSRCV